MGRQFADKIAARGRSLEDVRFYSFDFYAQGSTVIRTVNAHVGDMFPVECERRPFRELGSPVEAREASLVMGGDVAGCVAAVIRTLCHASNRELAEAVERPLVY